MRAYRAGRLGGIQTYQLSPPQAAGIQHHPVGPLQALKHYFLTPSGEAQKGLHTHRIAPLQNLKHYFLTPSENVKGLHTYRVGALQQLTHYFLTGSGQPVPIPIGTGGGGTSRRRAEPLVDHDQDFWDLVRIITLSGVLDE